MQAKICCCRCGWPVRGPSALGTTRCPSMRPRHHTHTHTHTRIPCRPAHLSHLSQLPTPSAHIPPLLYHPALLTAFSSLPTHPALLRTQTSLPFLDLPPFRAIDTQTAKSCFVSDLELRPDFYCQLRLSNKYPKSGFGTQPVHLSQPSTTGVTAPSKHPSHA